MYILGEDGGKRIICIYQRNNASNGVCTGERPVSMLQVLVERETERRRHGGANAQLDPAARVMHKRRVFQMSEMRIVHAQSDDN